MSISAVFNMSIPDRKCQQNNFLSHADTQAMRGIAIFFIVIHNLFHLFLPVKENEFFFDKLNFDLFLGNLVTQPEWCWADIFSFLGWYGVAIFIFLSGYGLSQKYDIKETGYVPMKSYILSHWLKLIKLMIVPMILYAVLISIAQRQLFNPIKLLIQLCLLGNVVFPAEIDPGIFWFWCLIFQLYIVYRLLLFRRSLLPIVFINVLSLSLIISFHIMGNMKMVSNLMHNFVGWTLPFTCGILSSRYNRKFIYNTKWIYLLIFVISSLLICVMNSFFITWILSPVIAIISSVTLIRLIPQNKILLLLVWVGNLSAYIFAIHPIVRKIMIYTPIKSFFIGTTNPYNFGLFPYGILYLLITLLCAMVYKETIQNYGHFWKRNTL